MGWPFKRGRETTTKVVDDAKKTETVIAPPAPPTSDAPDVPRSGGFHFDGAPDPPPQPAEATRDPSERPAPRRPGARAADRGVAPMWVPGAREKASLYRLAADARAAEDPNEAQALWRAYLELCPTDATGWFVYGQCLAVSGQTDEAWDAFVAARRADPGMGLATGALGYLCRSRGDLDGAVRYYDEAVGLRPECVDMLEGLAEAQASIGRAEDALVTRERLERLRAPE